MVTIEDIKNRCIHLDRVEAAGGKRPKFKLGPLAILWVVNGKDREHWEILPKWFGELIVSDLHNQNVQRAKLYERPPKTAPMNVVAQWIKLSIAQKES